MTNDNTTHGLDLGIEQAEAFEAPSDTTDFIGGVLIGVGAGIIIVAVFT